MNRIPVYYHVPKCGGTYAVGMMLLLLNVYLQKQLFMNENQISELARNLEITHEGITVARVLSVGGDAAIGDPSDPTHGFRDLNNPGDLGRIFALIIEPGGFGMVDRILAIANIGALRKWMILRDPLKTAISLHSYLISSASSHETTHGNITLPLNDWLCSDQVPDCWLLRTVFNIPDEEIIDQARVEMGKEWIRAIKCYDLSEIDKAIDDVFYECYGLLRSDIAPRALTALGSLNRLQSIKPQPSPEAIKAFRERAWADEEMWIEGTSQQI